MFARADLVLIYKNLKGDRRHRWPGGEVSVGVAAKGTNGWQKIWITKTSRSMPNTEKK